ncbi:hypothetical protein K505DRAFT_364434 [Melanomma pulvis-pyrius CBS 109.77]|uniref:Uncharacterized protein n=1 Tax=Melanomma pulvis-pyrius CBS 109.77 TaxID=1314802 RepID=A0A6A6X3R0_9PLEO|nr:hypothetical protein K505DRAFT_364434 [Melanomma pulvis-pyrius CBS 109.77]
MHEPGLDGWILGLRQDEHAAWKGKGHIAQFVSSSLFRSHQTVAMSASITDKEAETGCAKPEKQRHATIEYRPGACSNTLMASARSDQPPNMPAPLGPASSSASTATRNYRRRSGAIIDITSSDWRGWNLEYGKFNSFLVFPQQQSHYSNPSTIALYLLRCHKGRLFGKMAAPGTVHLKIQEEI